MKSMLISVSVLSHYFVHRSRKKEEWDAKKKARADPLAAMNRISNWFDRRREQKVKEEAVRMRRANDCISAMPSLFPDDISVPKVSATQNPLPLDTKRKRRTKHEGDYTTDSTRPAHLSPLRLHDNFQMGTASEAVNSVKQSNIDTLRAERLQRERRERERAAVLIAKAAGLPEAYPEEEKLPDERTLPFNSAFNPELSAALAERRQKKWRRF